MQWRKARRSQNNPSCVELNNTLDHVRDSKNATGPVLRGDLPALVRAVRAGRVNAPPVSTVDHGC
ncbi:MAG TPA: DUF397 domain-containing protein [Micromonosporaceae bacterium]|nr:DUF397 domain-containing protein [Micromonosporaceae bacterium]